MRICFLVLLFSFPYLSSYLVEDSFAPTTFFFELDQNYPSLPPFPPFIDFFPFASSMLVEVEYFPYYAADDDEQGRDIQSLIAIRYHFSILFHFH